MKINRPLKNCLIAGILVATILTMYTLLLPIFQEGRLRLLLLSILAGALTTLFAGFIYVIHKHTKASSEYLIKDETYRLKRRKNLIVIILCYLVLFLGALSTRYSVWMKIPPLISIAISGAAFAIYSYYSGGLKRPLKSSLIAAYISIVIIALIQFSISCFIFLLLIHGFDFNAAMSMFWF